MVYTCDKLLAALKIILHLKFLEQRLAADLNRVAKTDSLDTCVSLHITRKHCHGVCVVQKPSIGANLFHIACKVFQHGHSAQRAHDTAYAEGVGDCLSETVLFGNLKVYNGAGVI